MPDKVFCPHCGPGDSLPSPEKASEMALAMPTPPSLRASEKAYEERLGTCAVCESLRMGVFCAHCGCYVQFRAIPVKGRCPHPAGDKWA